MDSARAQEQSGPNKTTVSSTHIALILIPFNQNCIGILFTVSMVDISNNADSNPPTGDMELTHRTPQGTCLRYTAGFLHGVNDSNRLVNIGCQCFFCHELNSYLKRFTGPLFF